MKNTQEDDRLVQRSKRNGKYKYQENTKSSSVHIKN